MLVQCVIILTSPSDCLGVIFRLAAAQPALFAIPYQRPVFLREYSTNHYSVTAYFMSSFTIEAILTAIQCLVAVLLSYFLIGFQANFFLFYLITYVASMCATAMAVLVGCAIEDPKMAQEFYPILFIPQMLFAGFFVAISLLPNWLQWVPFICSLSYGIKLGILAEFEDCVGSQEPGYMNCQQIFINADAASDQKWLYWVVLAAIFVVTRLLALYVLKRNASTFY